MKPYSPPESEETGSGESKTEESTDKKLKVEESNTRMLGQSSLLTACSEFGLTDGEESLGSDLTNLANFPKKPKESSSSIVSDLSNSSPSINGGISSGYVTSYTPQPDPSSEDPHQDYRLCFTPIPLDNNQQGNGCTYLDGYPGNVSPKVTLPPLEEVFEDKTVDSNDEVKEIKRELHNSCQELATNPVDRGGDDALPTELYVRNLSAIGLLKKDAVEFDSMVFSGRLVNTLGGSLMALTYYLLSDAKDAAIFPEGLVIFTCVCSAVVNAALYELLVHELQKQAGRDFIGNIERANYMSAFTFVVAAIGLTALAAIPSSPMLAACLNTELKTVPVIAYMAFGVRALGTALSIPKLFGEEKEIDIVNMIKTGWASGRRIFVVASLLLTILYTFSQHSGMTKAIEDVDPSYSHLAPVWHYLVECAGMLPLICFNIWWIEAGLDELFGKAESIESLQDTENVQDMEAQQDNSLSNPAGQEDSRSILGATLFVCLWTGVAGVMIAFAGHDDANSTEFSFEEWWFMPYIFAAGAYAAAVIMNVGSTMRFCSGVGDDPGPKGVFSALLEKTVTGGASLAQGMVSGVSSYCSSFFGDGGPNASRSDSDDRPAQLRAPLLGDSSSV